MHQAPSRARKTNLIAAADNTVSATSYTEDYTSNVAGQPTSVFHLVYQAPDRAAGYEETQGKRLYIVVVGSTIYQGLPVAENAVYRTVRFYRTTLQSSWASLDPVQANVGFVVNAPAAAKRVSRHGDTYAFPANNSQQGITVLTYVVDGPYVSKFAANVDGPGPADRHLRGRRVPPVTLPSLKDLVAPPAGAAAAPAPRAGRPRSTRWVVPAPRTGSEGGDGDGPGRVFRATASSMARRRVGAALAPGSSASVR